jgi:hypothetical protein
MLTPYCNRIAPHAKIAKNARFDPHMWDVLHVLRVQVLVAHLFCPLLISGPGGHRCSGWTDLILRG